jgi:IS4 transposase
VRAKWNGARWLDTDGGKIDLIKLLKKARKDCLDRPIWIGRPGGAPLAPRLVAIGKPPEATEKTRTRLLAKAREKQHVLQDGTLAAAGWVILITSLDAAAFPAKAVGDLYRLRWRIEIAFKHLKSGAGLARPPGEDARVAKVHILCHLLMIPRLRGGRLCSLSRSLPGNSATLPAGRPRKERCMAPLAIAGRRPLRRNRACSKASCYRRRGTALETAHH